VYCSLQDFEELQRADLFLLGEQYPLHDASMREGLTRLGAAAGVMLLVSSVILP
jgi:hypothetical protein